jgi:DNA-binding transcriptional regulator YhcF (GntR family)
MATKNLALELDLKSGVPLYIQIKQQIGSLISAEVWEMGFKLPTERELANILGVSRNTVSAAYKELEADGLLVSLQGRGTFVAGEQAEKEKTGRKGRLLKVVDLALEEAAELGFGPDDFLKLATTRALERKESLGTVDVAFIGTSMEQALYFQRELVPQTGIKTVPFLLNEIQDDPATARKNLISYDLIVTTFPEIDKLQELIQPSAIPILGIALGLELETIVRIARLPKNSTLALVCSTEAFAATVKESLHDSGIDDLIIVPTTEAGAKLASVLVLADAVAVTAGRTAEVLNMMEKAKEMEIIELRYRIDQGSLNMFRCYLTDLRNKT